MQARIRNGNRSPQAGTLFLHDGDLRFEDAAPGASRTLRRLGELALVVGKAAGAALRRLDDHGVPGDASRSDHVLEVRFDLVTLQTELTGDARDRPRAGDQDIDQLPSKCHSSYWGARLQP